jgi:transcriptional regulator with XRE-family HTH domain
MTTTGRQAMIQGSACRHLRQSLGLTQEQLALAAGLDHSALSLLERGLRRGRATTWRRIFSALGVDEKGVGHAW